MLRYQVLLIAVIICCFAFTACERMQGTLEDVMVEPESEMDSETMEVVMDMLAHRSWMSVDLPGPTMTVAEAKAAMNPHGTGAAHQMGARTVYFNEAAAMANMTSGPYPAGSMIVKEVMDEAGTEIVHVATMTKTDDAMYAAHGGWIYGVGGNNFTVEGAAGCDACHAAVKDHDYVFVSLTDDHGMDDGGMEDDTDNGGMEDDTDNGGMEDDTDNGGMEDDTDNGGMEDDTDNGGMEDDTDNGGMEDDTDNGGMEDDTDNGGMEDDTDNGDA